MLVWLILLFTVLPLVELGLLFWIADHTAWQFTLGLVVSTGILGAWLARLQGLRCLNQFRQRLAQGELPTDPLLDGLMILVAAAVLVTPGVLTDLVGFSLLVPPLRRLIRERLARRFRVQVARGPTQDAPDATTHHEPGRNDDVIDVAHFAPGESDDRDEERST